MSRARTASLAAAGLLNPATPHPAASRAKVWFALMAATAIACGPTNPRPEGDAGRAAGDAGTAPTGPCVLRSEWTLDAHPSICGGWCGSLLLACHADTECEVGLEGHPTVKAICPLIGHDGTKWCENAIGCAAAAR